MMILMSGMVVAVLRAEEDAWLRNGWLANIWWWCNVNFPLSDHVFLRFPRVVRIAIMAAQAGCLLAFLVSLVIKAFLVMLLQYKGWILEKDPRKPGIVTKLWGLLLTPFTGTLLVD